MSSTSARGKLVPWRDRVIALVHDSQDLVIFDVKQQVTVGRIQGAGGVGCQEVLYDVSSSSKCLC